jgi:hypothetical protein
MVALVLHLALILRLAVVVVKLIKVAVQYLVTLLAAVVMARQIQFLDQRMLAVVVVAVKLLALVVAVVVAQVLI